MSRHYSDFRTETRLVHAGSPDLEPKGAGPVNVPVVRASTVRFDKVETMAAYHQRRSEGERVAAYGRHGLDTHQALEDAVTSLEGGYRAFLTPSGLSAIALVFIALSSPGDHILVVDSVYSPIHRIDKGLLSRYGIELEFFSPSRNDVAALIRPNTRLLYLESPGSLIYEVLDFPASVALARRHGVLVATDNTWSGGYFFKPLSFGANISIQAATKYLAGHSDVMQGIVIVDSPELAARLGAAYDALGLTVGADDAYLTLRGIRTLAVRMQRHQINATEVATYLSTHPAVLRVFYPALPTDPGYALWKRDFTGASGLVSFSFRQNEASIAAAFVNALTLFSIGASWGGYESLAVIADPALLGRHSGWQGTNTLVRLHIGLENPQDLIWDLDRAFHIAEGAGE